MNRRVLTNVSVMTFLGLVALPGGVLGQQKSLTEQLQGAWPLVSIDYVRADGAWLVLPRADGRGGGASVSPLLTATR